MKCLFVLPMDIQQRVGQNIRRARTAAGLSQWQLVARIEALAEDTGVDQPYLSGLEAGRRNPTIQTLWLVAKALGVPLTQITDDGANQAPD